MEYAAIVKGIFIDRPNRFIAHVNVEGETQTVHVKNTGRCKELLVPGCTVILEDFRNRQEGQNRKTKFDLIAVYKKISPEHKLYSQCKNGELLINMDSQAPNKVVLEWLQALEPEFAFNYIKPEYTFGNSRVDFYMEKNTATEDKGTEQHEKNTQKFLLEVKGCTLEKSGTGYFPDAPTERGVKHLLELAHAAEQGYKCYVAFVIQVPGVKQVFPNLETHPQFGQALEQAKSAGVQVLFLQCTVWEQGLKITNNPLNS